MDLADEIAHRALAYVAATQRQGYVMTVDELEAYMARPGRRPGTSGTPGRPGRTVRTTNIERALGQMARGAIEPTLKALAASAARSLEIEEQYIEGTPGTPGTPPETTTDWLTRLRWLRADDQRVRTTSLGDAMLRHLEQTSLEEEIPVSVLLDQGDELAEARVISQIAEVGPCAVVDRFFSIDSLLHIVHSTQVEMVLTGTTDRAKLAGLEVALPGLNIDRAFEIRKSDVFHDRFVIPTAGPVWLLGTSFTGLGRRLSMLIELRDETVSAAIRCEFREAWEGAEPVVPGELEAQPETSEAEAQPGARSEDGDQD